MCIQRGEGLHALPVADFNDRCRNRIEKLSNRVCMMEIVDVLVYLATNSGKLKIKSRYAAP
jgi:hypothetical protein